MSTEQTKSDEQFEAWWENFDLPMKTRDIAYAAYAAGRAAAKQEDAEMVPELVRKEIFNDACGWEDSFKIIAAALRASE